MNRLRLRSLSHRKSLIVQQTEDVEKSGEADQTDGAPAELGGSDLQEPDYTVEVKLSDLQADPNNPLFSVKNFEDLGM